MAISWAAKKQLTYLLLLLSCGRGVDCRDMAEYYRPKLYRRQAGPGRKGIDCGGPLRERMPREIKDLAVLWSKPLKVAGSNYDAVALVENRNLFLSAKSARYQFKFYDVQKHPICLKRRGNFLNPGGEVR